MKKIVTRVLKFIKRLFKSKRRFIAVLLIIFLLIAAFFFIRPNNKSGQLQYETVKRGDIRSEIAASGTLNGKASVSLRFKVGGKLAYVNFDEGQKVFVGQIVAGFDTQDLNIQLQQAKNNLRDKQATLDKILDDIYLFQYGNGGFANVGSSSETMTQRQLRTAAQVSKDNAVDQVKAIERSFQDTVLVSPISGTVVKSDFFAGQNISPSDVVLEVVDDSEIFFDAEVDESDINQVSVNQSAEVTLNGYPNQTLKGFVSEIKPVTKTTTSGATVVIARIKLSGASIRLTSGLNGQASIIKQQAENIVKVPTEAIRSDDTVFIKTVTDLKSVKIKKGIISDSEVEIKEGLKEGDLIVKNPQNVKK